MDKRKLKVGKFTRMGDTCLELETRGLCAIMGAGNQMTREEDAAELAKRWNEYPQQAERIAKLEEALADMVSTASEVEGMMDGDKDKQEAWTEELGRLYVALDDARAILQTLKP